MDLGRAFDRVTREVISWAMRKVGVEEWLVSAVMSVMKTVVRTIYGNREGFEVKVGMHHGLNEWKDNIESKGMRVIMNNTNVENVRG